ncbi:unnamed protein product [Paramecium sonneborni]|uniref:Uncharacterized protein n=1 Tax=Paramecium sonneborni TaxID=65129 RepID=A0A8S1RJY1_9CILI|nr:unnamed protein product [Paramecium sonneborni]
MKYQFLNQILLFSIIIIIQIKYFQCNLLKRLLNYLNYQFKQLFKAVALGKWMCQINQKWILQITIINNKNKKLTKSQFLLKFEQFEGTKQKLQQILHKLKIFKWVKNIEQRYDIQKHRILLIKQFNKYQN